MTLYSFVYNLCCFVPSLISVLLCTLKNGPISRELQISSILYHFKFQSYISYFDILLRNSEASDLNTCFFLMDLVKQLCVMESLTFDS